MDGHWLDGRPITARCPLAVFLFFFFFLFFSFFTFSPLVRCSFLARFHELDGFFFIIEVWILPSFDGYEVLTGFALILLSLSGFYWVLLGFTGLQ